jgi:regulator of protease activity HflC (stomatin/prohibitin superfamily)
MDHVNGMKWGIYEIPEKVELLTDEERDRIASNIMKHEAETNRRINEARAAEEAEAEKIVASSDEDAEILDEIAQPGLEEPDPAEWSRSLVKELPSYKDRYIEQLLKMLESGKHSDEVIVIEVMGRLDKLLLGEDK